MKIICSDESSLVWIKTFSLLVMVSNIPKEGTFPRLRSGVLLNDTQSSFYNFMFPPTSEWEEGTFPVCLSPQILEKICVCISLLKPNLVLHCITGTCFYTHLHTWYWKMLNWFSNDPCINLRWSVNVEIANRYFWACAYAFQKRVSFSPELSKGSFASKSREVLL